MKAVEYINELKKLGVKPLGLEVQKSFIEENPNTTMRLAGLTKRRTPKTWINSFNNDDGIRALHLKMHTGNTDWYGDPVYRNYAMFETEEDALIVRLKYGK